MSIINRSTVHSKYFDPTLQQIISEKSISNSVAIENLSIKFEKKLDTDKSVVTPNETINQKLLLTNNSAFDIVNINIKSILNDSAKFVKGSVKVNNVSYPNFDIVKGFNLPQPLDKSSKIIIQYSLKVDQAPPFDKVLSHIAINYTANGEKFEENTNKTLTRIIDNNIEIKKTASSYLVTPKSQVTITHKITNLCKFSQNNLLFVDLLPSDVVFVDGSVKIDGILQPELNAVRGIKLKCLSQNSATTITYDVRIK